ncbi:F-box domain containing protein [Trema orientale]|uniref:F-box domain containing protein n=1 Tax=Trema orientale TaxID=63057 RepID=A0A2P5EAY9_TREOI|nr:F-box domain containing protein [Trema orientale]
MTLEIHLRIFLTKRTTHSGGRAPWSDLPNELLEVIACRLHNKTDVTRFRSVCESWRSSILPFQETLILPQQVPYLGPACPPELERPLLLAESTVYRLSPPPADDGGCPMASSGSTSWGWLIKLNQSPQPQPGRFHVMNPLCRHQFQPLPNSFPKVIDSLQFRVFEMAKSYTLQFSNLTYCNYKVALSPSPDCPSLMIVASGVLWHIKLGHGRWTAIDDMVSQLSYEDVIIYQGKFCAVDELGRTMLVDSSMHIMEIASPSPIMAGGDKKNLVVSNGELLLVDAYFKVPYFRVFKLNVDQRRWVEIRSLDDQILLLGHDCSLSVSARDFGGCKGNCIIYADSSYRVFDLDDGSFFPVHRRPEYARIFHPPSTWSRSSPGLPANMAVFCTVGKFCAVDELGRTALLDSSSLHVTEIALSNPEEMARCHSNRKKKLIESNGELPLVDTYLFRESPNSSARGQKFGVFKLNVEQNRWFEIRSLDDQILFLGHDCSFADSARHGGCKGNCILFTDSSAVFWCSTWMTVAFRQLIKTLNTLVYFTHHQLGLGQALL